jgi:tetratricopeptide (TPR) repeat protein
MRFRVRHTSQLLVFVLCLGVLAGCALPAPYSPPAPAKTPVPEPPPPVGSAPQVETAPATPPEVAPPAEPLPPQPIRERTLNPAARTLVSQAQAQTAAGNYAIAAANLERALRIEPDSAQLWIEMGRVRQAEGNFPQAENMARKALSLAAGDARNQAAAWRLIADSYRSRKRVQEAQDADVRADALTPN